MSCETPRTQIFDTTRRFYKLENGEKRCAQSELQAYATVCGNIYPPPFPAWDSSTVSILDASLLEVRFIQLLVDSWQGGVRINRDNSNTQLTGPRYFCSVICFDAASRPSDTTATGSMPYVVVLPSWPAARAAGYKGFLSHTLDVWRPVFTGRAAIHFIRSCARELQRDILGKPRDNSINSKTAPRPNSHRDPPIPSRLHLLTSSLLALELDAILDYFLWLDREILEVWTLRILRRAMPCYAVKQLMWSRRQLARDTLQRIGIEVFQATEGDFAREAGELRVFDRLRDVIASIVEHLQNSNFVDSDTEPGLLDGVIFSRLTIFYSLPVSEHELLKAALDGETRTVLVKYCRRVNKCFAEAKLPNVVTNLNMLLFQEDDHDTNKLLFARNWPPRLYIDRQRRQQRLQFGSSNPLETLSPPEATGSNIAPPVRGIAPSLQPPCKTASRLQRFFPFSDMIHRYATCAAHLVRTVYLSFYHPLLLTQSSSPEFPNCIPLPLAIELGYGDCGAISELRTQECGLPTSTSTAAEISEPLDICTSPTLDTLPALVPRVFCASAVAAVGIALIWRYRTTGHRV